MCAVGAGQLPLAAHVDPGPSAQGLEGACRDGHFEGVATIVSRLFDVVEPTRAYFGQKDFQQLCVVRDLARRRGRPEIVGCAIEREPSGLARSSRNKCFPIMPRLLQTRMIHPSMKHRRKPSPNPC